MTIPELLGIKGIGEAKMNRYGKDIVDIITAYENEADF